MKWTCHLLVQIILTAPLVFTSFFEFAGYLFSLEIAFQFSKLRCKTLHSLLNSNYLPSHLFKCLLKAHYTFVENCQGLRCLLFEKPPGHLCMVKWWDPCFSRVNFGQPFTVFVSILRAYPTFDN